MSAIVLAYLFARLDLSLDAGAALVDDRCVSLPRRAISATLGTAAAVATVLAVIYLVVACESLPGVLGPVAGDSQPRTKLGAAILLVAVILATGAVLATRLRDNRR